MARILFWLILLLALPAFAQTDFQSLANQAAAARDAGRAADAIRFYQQALQHRPTWDEGLWYLGSLYYDTDHYREVIPVFRQLSQQQPDAGPVWNLLGLSEYETGDYKSALPHLQKGLQLGFADNPGAVKVAKYHVAMLLNLNGEFERAIEVLATEFGGGAIPDQIKVVLGLALLRVPLLPNQVDPSKDALIHLASDASALVVQKNFAQAIESFQQLKKDYPETPFLHYSYGMTLAAASRNQEAAAEFRQQVQATPQFAKAHESLAQVLQKLGKSSESATESAAAKRLDANAGDLNAAQAKLYARESVTNSSPTQTVSTPSGDFDSLVRQAAAARQAGRAEEAIAGYQQAVKIRPNWDEGWSLIGTIYYTTGRCVEAVPAFKTSVGINPKRSEAWALLGICEFQTKDYKNALIHLQNANQIGFAADANAVKFAKYHIALLLNLQGDFDQATSLLIPEAGPSPFAEQINLAMGLALLRMPVLPEQIQPSQQALVTNAGKAAGLLAQNKYDEAYPLIQQLLKDYPNTPFIHYVYGTALASNSQYDQAKAQLLEEIRISPKSALPHLRMAAMSLILRAPEDALASAQKATQLEPNAAEGHYLMGRAYLELKRTDDAVKELETASRLAPGSPEVHFNLAKAYTKAKQPEAAEREREIFNRLNSLAEQQKSKQGSQTYAGSRDQGGLNPSTSEQKSNPE